MLRARLPVWRQKQRNVQFCMNRGLNFFIGYEVSITVSHQRQSINGTRSLRESA